MPEGAPDPGGGQVRRTLFEDRSPRRLLRGWVTSDGMLCGLDCRLLAGPWAEADDDELAVLLGSHRVVHGIDRTALEAVAAAARAGRGTSGQAVARGTPAEPGRDGALDFAIRPSGEPGAPRPDGSNGRVDYRETGLVENVLAGEPVAVEIPPRPGQDGRDVFGRVVAAAQGRPARYRLGQGVRFDEASRQVIATSDGRVTWEDKVVSVSRTLCVPGPVDYSVGNIAFVGDVIVEGEVLDGFSVRAGGNLSVGGNVGACQLDSEGNLSVRGGVFGKGRARLRAKGRLSARFLNDCTAESAGAMTVEREVVGSTVFAGGALLIPDGRVVGGSACALRGVDAGTLGSPLGVPTSVAAGTDYNLARRQAEVEARLAEVEKATARITDFLAPLMTDRPRLGELIRRRRGDMERLARALRDLRDERAELAGKLDELAAASRQGAVRQVNVRSEMHSGVLLEIGTVRHRVRQLNAGPVSITEDRARAALRTGPLRPLPGGKAAADAPEAHPGKDTAREDTGGSQTH